MNPDQIQQFTNSLLRTAETLQSEMERIARLPIIHPRDIVDALGPVIGELHGTARAIEWHAKHGEGRS